MGEFGPGLDLVIRVYCRSRVVDRDISELLD